MKALRWHGVKDLRLENINEPQPEEGKVKIKVEWCGICGSDLHEYTAGPIFIPGSSTASVNRGTSAYSYGA